MTAAFAAAAAALAGTTPPDRTEVQRTAASLGAAFSPFTPAVEEVRAWRRSSGSTRTCCRADGAAAGRGRLWPSSSVPSRSSASLRSVLTRLIGRITDLVDASWRRCRTRVGDLAASSTPCR